MSQLLRDHKGLIACVSRANSVGYAIAQECVEQGAQVALACRPARLPAVEPLGAEVGAGVVALDATDEALVARAVEEAAQHLGGIDFLVHTLVSVPDGALERPLMEVTRSDFEAVMDVGVRSLLVLARECVPWLKRSSHPRIVTLLSPGAQYAIANYHLVGIAKAALASAVRYLALELGSLGIACNAVSFSMLETDTAQQVIGRSVTRGTVDYVTRHSMTQRPLEPRDVAKTVAFLSSSECRNVTGENITVDGGYTVNYF